MQLNKYTSGIIFVDDKVSQVKPLIDFCREQSINVQYIDPTDFDPQILYIGYRIVFMDLAFDDGIVDFTRIINIIRGISDNGEKHLLLVAWTQREGDIEALKDQIEEKMGDNLPLALLNAQKSKLLSLKTKEEFNDLISSIFDSFITENTNLFNLLEWKENYFKSINEEFHDFVIEAYSDKVDPILIDKRLGLYAVKTLAPKEMLSALEVLNIKVSDNSLSRLNLMDKTILQYDEEHLEFDDKYKFNYEMMFDKKSNNNDIPGSIYKINEYSYEELNNEITNKKEEEYSKIEILFSKLKTKNIIFKRISHILINLTPNCTFASGHKNTTYCEGYLIYDICDYKNVYKKLDEIKGYNSSNLEKCIYSYLYSVDGFCRLIICFDSCQSSNNENTKILQLKSNIKLNIQQKYSSWISRIGDILNH